MDNTMRIEMGAALGSAVTALCGKDLPNDMSETIIQYADVLITSLDYHELQHAEIKQDCSLAILRGCRYGPRRSAYVCSDKVFRVGSIYRIDVELSFGSYRAHESVLARIGFLPCADVDTCFDADVDTCFDADTDAKDGNASLDRDSGNQCGEDVFVTVRQKTTVSIKLDMSFRQIIDRDNPGGSAEINVSGSHRRGTFRYAEQVHGIHPHAVKLKLGANGPLFVQIRDIHVEQP